MSPPAQHSFEFGPFRLDLSERVLLCDGKAVQLGPKVFETLVVLVENSGRILEKDELLKKVWPDSFVVESSLAQNIFQLRKALDDGRSRRRYIETIPKRGYRFAVDVREIMERADSVAAPYPTNGRGFFGESQNGIVIKSLAVLPFNSLGEEKAGEYLGLGMADTTITKLGRLRDLVVMPTSTVLKYAGRKGDTLAIGRKLHVDAILEGTIQRAGERVRVNVQLIALESAKTLWSGKFDEHFTDIFDVQDSISEQVAGALALRITGAERRHLRKRYTENTEAYQSYLMGLFFWNKKSKEGLNKAVEYFQQAIQEDPAYALPYAGLADSYFWIAYGQSEAPTRREYFEKSRTAALKALALDPFVAEAHAALATIKVKHDHDTVGAERSFERAIATNPNCAMAYSRYTYFLAAMGRLGESLQKIRRAQQLDPLSPDANASLAYILYFARDYDESIRYCQRVLALEPDFLEALLLLGLSYEQKGMLEEAIAQFRKAKDLSGDNPEPLELLGHALAVAGQEDEARKVLSELHSSVRQNCLHPYNVALIHATLGERKKAFEELSKPYANWTERLRMLRFDPRMDSLRADSRFTALFQGSVAATQI
jgi:DNA-binding winged helix-turn-helix (wHTH) protein/TolB-like protein/Flp pilus assembly protein TadD